jgi:stage V sporulation protein S
MNRFFSKLDLRDIKIDPEGSRFPPDADETRSDEPVAGNGAPPQVAPVEQETIGNEFEPAIWESNTFPAAPVTNFPTAEPSVPAQPIIQSDVVLEQQDGSALQQAFGIEGVIVSTDGEVLKVSARSRPSAVAGAIAGVVREAGRAEVQAIGAGATNQAVKAVAIAREYLRETGIDAVCLPAFIDVTIDNEDRTAIRLVVEAR